MKWIALLLVCLCGCAAKHVLPPPQLPMNDFSVTAFPNGVFLIAHKGAPDVLAERAIDLALLKASQVAQEQQFKFFVVIDQPASRPGEIKFRQNPPDPADWNRELMIQAFRARPVRVFCYRAESTERAIYEKLRAAEEGSAL